jgi:hypothetical protein
MLVGHVAFTLRSLFPRAPPEIVNTVVKITDASQPIREKLTKVLRINTHLCLSVQYLQVASEIVGIPLSVGLVAPRSSS